MATVLALQRMSVLDELKPSMLLLCDMRSVRESNQVWQHRASSRGPAGRVSVSASTCVCVYLLMCPQHTHAHSHYVFNHACPTSSLSVTSMGKAFGVWQYVSFHYELHYVNLVLAFWIFLNQFLFNQRKTLLGPNPYLTFSQGERRRESTKQVAYTVVVKFLQTLKIEIMSVFGSSDFYNSLSWNEWNTCYFVKQNRYGLIINLL